MAASTFTVQCSYTVTDEMVDDTGFWKYDLIRRASKDLTAEILARASELVTIRHNYEGSRRAHDVTISLTVLQNGKTNERH